MSAEKSIRIIGDGVQKEALASGTVSPGMLVEITNAAVDTVKAHATAGGNAQTAFALEDDLQGNGIDDNYASDARVLYAIFGRGDEVLALINDGENIAKGDLLESAGNGKLRKLVAQNTGSADSSSGGISILTRQIVGQAKEACDMSDSSTVDPNGRCRIEIW